MAKILKLVYYGRIDRLPKAGVVLGGTPIVIAFPSAGDTMIGDEQFSGHDYVAIFDLVEESN